ncbi:contact-dependent growth inhibition system immunity protein [Streptomyces sp. NPDC085927]|uniref:contact-dependent growth inhibition system immunity protein n=1 Tax=Streptomyces sp. NPDC085927 TaxID=3365738 RepID=UPI0037D0DDEC
MAQNLPRNKWEHREHFPEPNQFLGSYFHQDFSDEYTSHREAVGDYLAGASETDLEQLVRDISELLAPAATDADPKQAASVLGMDVSPPPGVGIRQWLDDVAGIASRRTGR